MVETREVGKNVFLIDNELYGIPRSGAVYLLVEKKKALIDTGPATSAETVIKGIRQIGIRAEDIDYIILTHIHLDHGGGAGTLMQRMPGAKVIAHYKAVKHLVSPARLMQSSIEAQGEEVLIRNGEVVPIDESRVLPIRDSEVLDLSDGQELTFLECPGHAPHEIGIWEKRNRALFVGDAVGHIVEETDVMVPITPPPAFDMELYLQTLERLKELNASRIYFPHFGTSGQVEQKIKSAANELNSRNAIITDAFAKGNIKEAAQMVIEHVQAGLSVIKEKMPELFQYWLSVDVPMSANEHVRYFTNKQGQ
jgi:glyoxylase-like metal-dependent hydrolase (beta-lactamase superfamily II)